LNEIFLQISNFIQLVSFALACHTGYMLKSFTTVRKAPLYDCQRDIAYSAWLWKWKPVRYFILLQSETVLRFWKTIALIVDKM